MSFQAMAWATEQKLATREKFVLIMLANYASNDQWDCHPSVNTLADDTGMSRDTVMRAIKSLEKLGYLQIIRRMADGINLPNIYRLIRSAGGSSTVQGVVAVCGGGSSTQQGGVVAVCDSNQSLEPINKPISHTPRATQPSTVVPNTDTPPDPKASPKKAPFLMTLDWKPEQRGLEARATRAGLPVSRLNPDAISGFILHHEAKGLAKTEGEWQAALINWVKRDVAQETAPGSATHKAKTGRSSSPPDFHDTSWRTMTEHDL